MRLFFALTLFVLSMTVARAQGVISQAVDAPADYDSFSGTLSTSYNSNFARQTDAASEQSISGELILNYNPTKNNVLRAYLPGTKEITQGQEWKADDGYLAWANGSFWSANKTLTIGQQIRVHAPLSKDSRLRDSKVTGVSLLPVFVANMAPSLSLTYQPALTKNFHTYQVNREGKTNAEYGLSHSIIGNWMITENLYFQPTYIYRNSWSYGGARRNPSYLMSGEMGYAINQTFALAAGWTNDQVITRSAVGTDREQQAFNNETSTFFATLHLNF